ncbi:LOW QUALITY PROTEIN: hypothetical protein Cgig2_008303 [Carnegiea gigantea]|uniref:RRM domain-containing protein n=1 Tax=Carnegiea gigantea TaxID=171969 RepID=A0A9Q1GNF5_9CARY|nr:LOW QUALITY PROTEIN: hypothetical protein Cgig2_008303 [Carnegiea gigantea]
MKESRLENSHFVNNLPEELDIHGLKGIFLKVGRGCDARIPQRRTRRFKIRFGFVRFGRKEEALKGIFNQATIRGRRIQVAMAKASKSMVPAKVIQQHNQNWQWREWLKRSLVCTSEEPKDLATLSSAIINGYGQCSKICALSSYKFIMTYPTKPLTEEALELHEELDL